MWVYGKGETPEEGTYIVTDIQVHHASVAATLLHPFILTVVSSQGERHRIHSISSFKNLPPKYFPCSPPTAAMPTKPRGLSAATQGGSKGAAPPPTLPIGATMPAKAATAVQSPEQGSASNTRKAAGALESSKKPSPKGGDKASFNPFKKSTGASFNPFKKSSENADGGSSGNAGRKKSTKKMISGGVLDDMSGRTEWSKAKAKSSREKKTKVAAGGQA